MRFRTHLLVALLLLMLAPTGCTRNAATGRMQLTSLSRAEEIALGEQAMPGLIDGYGGPVPHDGAQQYVSEIGATLASHTEAEYPNLPWEFTLLNTDVVNAFALPGGKVFVTRGLVEQLSDESQLAGVLGHEIGHVTAEHADKQLTAKKIAIGGTILVTVAAGQSDNDLVRTGVPLLVGAGTGVYMLHYSRSDELQSDTLGLRYMTRAGYNPTGLLGVMAVFERLSKGKDRGPEWLSTHPLPTTRIERIERELATTYLTQASSKTSRIGARTFDQRLLRPLQSIPVATSVTADTAQHFGWCAHCAANAAAQKNETPSVPICIAVP